MVLGIKKFSKRVFFVILLSFLFLSPYAFAQKKGGKAGGQKKVIQLKELVIKQRVIKPQAMFILTKSQQSKIRSDIVTSQNFSESIIETTEGDFLK